MKNLAAKVPVWTSIFALVVGMFFTYDYDSSPTINEQSLQVDNGPGKLKPPPRLTTIEKLKREFFS